MVKAISPMLSERSKAVDRHDLAHAGIGHDDVQGRECHCASSSERNVMPWFYLIIGGLFEVGFTTSLRFVDGFRNLPWTFAFLGSVAVSMGLLELASRSIAMGTAYAVWGGIGAVGTVLVGILWFHEPASAVRLFLLLAIVASIGALRLIA